MKCWFELVCLLYTSRSKTYLPSLSVSKFKIKFIRNGSFATWLWVNFFFTSVLGWNWNRFSINLYTVIIQIMKMNLRSYWNDQGVKMRLFFGRAVLVAGWQGEASWFRGRVRGGLLPLQRLQISVVFWWTNPGHQW